MDPRFQPSNNSPYPQNPHAYPQTNPYQAPGAQNGPSKYPTLPPIHNPQNNYPAQQYPQYLPNTGAPGGYLPPAQYGNVQNRPSEGEERERLRLTKEMEKLDKNLNGCLMICYKVWSYFKVLCSLFLIYISAGELYSKDYSNEFEKKAFIYMLIREIWILFQSYFAISSVNSKSLTKANVTWWMMAITLISSLVYEGSLINFLITYPYRHSLLEYFIGQVLFTINTIDLVFHVFLNMIAAWKVKKTLTERAKVYVQLIDHSFNNA